MRTPSNGQVVSPVNSLQESLCDRSKHILITYNGHETKLGIEPCVILSLDYQLAPKNEWPPIRKRIPRAVLLPDLV